MEDPRRELRFALEKYPERVEIAAVRDLLVDSARQNARRPAYLKVAVPDAVVKSLRGGRDEDVLLLVRLPREVRERAASPIVLPGE